MRQKIARQLRRDGFGKRTICSRGVVPRIAEHADFVFNLHHENGVVAAVGLFDVLHQGGKSARVGFLREVTNTAEARKVLIEMVEQARTRG